MEIVNWRIIAHPMNWVIVFLMVFIVMLAIHFILGDKFGIPGPSVKQPLPRGPQAAPMAASY